jgi:phosphoglycolate phosphatase
MLHELADYFNVPESDMLMIGDTSFDLDMAARAGAASVGVSYGVHPKVELLKYKPRRIVDEFKEIVAWLDSLQQRVTS